MRVAAGAYLVYVTRVFDNMLASIEQGRTGVEAASTVEDLAGALWGSAAGIVSSIAAASTGILVAVALWIVGGWLINSAWSRLSRLWPGWVRLLFKVLDAVFGLALVIALLYPLRLLSLLASHTSILTLIPLAKYIVVLYLLPLTLPLLKALASLYYSTEKKSRIGLTLILAGGVFYLYTMYLVYTALNPVKAVTAHLQALDPETISLHDAREIALAGLDAAEVVTLRTRLIVATLTTASLAYTTGFLLFQENLGILAGTRNLLRIRKKRKKEK